MTNTTFDFQLDEWNYQDGKHGFETVDYLVYERGKWTFDGVDIEAGSVTVEDEWTTVTFQQTFTSNPVILAQCVTANGPDAVTVRICDVDITYKQFSIRLQEEEGALHGGNHGPETVHYIMFEQNSEALLVNGVTDAWKILPFQKGGAYIPTYLFGTMQTFNGPDPCTLRGQMLEYGYHEIMLQEDTNYDPETIHSNSETVGILQLYKIPDWMKPDNLEVKLTLRYSPSTFPFYRNVEFVGQGKGAMPAPIYFNTRNGMEYTGTVTAAGLEVIQDFIYPNNRSYWDRMRFVNPGWNSPLDIERLEVWITYDTNRWQIALETDQYLASGVDYFWLDNDRGRKDYICSQMGWSYEQYETLVPPIKAIIGDLGKTGSSDETDSTAYNPKYGLEINAGPFYCGETISWYYCDAGYVLEGNESYNFESPGSVPGEMGDWFREAGRRYDYDRATQKFYFVNQDGSLDLNRTTVPKPGDYLGLYHHHAMMLLKWHPGNLTATIMENPYPVNLRTFSVHDQALVDTVFIGRIPDNDGREFGKFTFTQNSSDDWESVDLNHFFYNPIVIMGIPSYNGKQPSTMRVKDVTQTGFKFQLDEWDYLDGSHIQETVDYLVLESGCHTYNEKKIEAGRVYLADNETTFHFKQDFTSTPVMLAQCVSTTQSAAVTVRICDVDIVNKTFTIRLQEEEGSPDGGDHYIETVHYVLYEQGESATTGVSAFILNGVTHDWKSLPAPPQLYNGSYTASYLFGSIQTVNGGNPCALRHNMTGIGFYDIFSISIGFFGRRSDCHQCWASGSQKAR